MSFFFAHDVYVQQDSTDSASYIGYRNIMLDIINGLIPKRDPQLHL